MIDLTVARLSPDPSELFARAASELTLLELTVRPLQLGGQDFADAYGLEC